MKIDNKAKKSMIQNIHKKSLNNWNLRNRKPRNSLRCKDNYRRAHRKVRKSHKATVLSEEDRLALSKQREQEAMEELNRAIAPSQITRSAKLQICRLIRIHLQRGMKRIWKCLMKKKNNDEPLEVVKKVRVTSDYFEYYL